MDKTWNWEALSPSLSVCVSRQHKFGTDAVLLSAFARRCCGFSFSGSIACDLGTGCGIIPLLWYRNPSSRPKETWCVDIQPQAIAQLNATLDRYPNPNIHPLESDLKDLKGKIPLQSCHLVTCNPPYKKQGAGILSEEAPDRTARHETQCTIKDIAEASRRLLRQGGRLCLCQRPERLADVMEAMRANRIEPKRLRFVQKDSCSPPWLFLIEGRLGGKPFLQIEAPLLMEDGQGNPSTEIQGIYTQGKTCDKNNKI